MRLILAEIIIAFLIAQVAFIESHQHSHQQPEDESDQSDEAESAQPRAAPDEELKKYLEKSFFRELAKNPFVQLRFAKQFTESVCSLLGKKYNRVLGDCREITLPSWQRQLPRTKLTRDAEEVNQFTPFSF